MSEPTRLPQPLILIRGFGGIGVEDEKRIAYQGFNDGTVYPQKRGENYIYEGLILRLLKSNWQYRDATNVVGYYGSKVEQPAVLPPRLKTLTGSQIATRFAEMEAKGFFSGDKVVIDPAMALNLLESDADPCRTLWVFRYYDLNDRVFETYGKALVRLIDFLQALAADKNEVQPKVNIIAHSMGGLLVREAIQKTYPAAGKKAEEFINKVVTLGTPHRGISFQILRDWIPGPAEAEFAHFDPKFQANPAKEESFVNLGKHFPPERLLTVVGTNYRTYNIGASTLMNRLFSWSGEFGMNYNRSDGLVKQTSAQIPEAPRTFVHKCHGGFDSLVTARESFEVATRFFHGNVRARLRLEKAKIKRGGDFFGKSEFFFGVSIKPRRVDFDLFHQSAEAENCYGPFNKSDLSDPALNPVPFSSGVEQKGFPWAGPDRLIWEGFLDTSSILKDDSITTKDMVLRLDFYVGERDLFGVGFSDNVIFRKQVYVRALLPTKEQSVKLFLHNSEDFHDQNFMVEMQQVGDEWEFSVEGTGFEGTFRIRIDTVPEVG